MTSHPNPWVERFARPWQARLPHLVGQGSGGDFSTTELLGSDDGSVPGIPEAKAAWTTLQNQLTAESKPPSEIKTIKHSFVSAFNSVNDHADFGMNPADIAKAAGSYIKAIRTTAGAIEHVESLVSAAISGGIPPQQLVSTFMGTMIGIIAAAAPATAGVGAVIMAAFTAVMEVLNLLGLFGNSSPGVNVCGSTITGATPSGVVGCAVVFSHAPPLMRANAPTSPENWPASPATPLWRHFPVPSNLDDAGWFQGGYGAGISWPKKTSDGTAAYPYPDWWQSECSDILRLIDCAFPHYRLVECDASMGSALGESTAEGAQALSNFMGAFFVAWKANAEYALNGLVPKDDSQVLLHVARLWNLAHDEGAGVDLVRGNMPSLDYSQMPPPTHFGGGLGLATPSPMPLPGCAPGMLPYEAYLVGQLLNTGAASGPDAGLFRNGYILHLHTGPKKSVTNVSPRTIPLHIGAGTSRALAVYKQWNLHQWVDHYTPLSAKIARLNADPNLNAFARLA
jgi:hypothetical protein